MEWTFANIPKVLEELMGKSDKLIPEGARVHPREKEWFMLIKEVAQMIVDGGSQGELDPTNNSLIDLATTIPDCLTFTKGEAEKYVTRVSSFFPLLERDHLHGKKKRAQKIGNGSSAGVNAENSRPSSRNASAKGKNNSQQRVESSRPSSRNASAKGKNNSQQGVESSRPSSINASAKHEYNSQQGVKNSRSSSRNTSAEGKKNSVQTIENDLDDCIIVEEPKPASRLLQSGMDRTYVKDDSSGQFVTPVRRSRGPPPLSPKGQKRSDRVSRKLSKMLSLEQEMFQKKLKVIPAHSHEPRLVIRSSRFSVGKKKYSGLRDSHQSLALGSQCSSKTSMTAKKETFQCKEDAAAENLKKLKDARRKKMEEKKRIRDEKMERTKEKRIKLEQAKALSSKQKTSETTTRSTRAQVKTMETRTRSREPKEGSGPETVAKTSQADSKKMTPARTEMKKASPPASTNNREPTAPASTRSRAPKTPLPKRTRASTKSRGPRTPLPKKTPASTKSRGPQTPLPKKTPASTKSRGPQTPLPEETLVSAKSRGPSSTPETPSPKQTLPSTKSKGPSPPLKTPRLRGTASVKGRRPTPPLKAQPLKLTPTILSVQNTTVTVAKETEINNSSKRALTPTSPPAVKESLKLQEGTVSTSGQKLEETSSPHPSKKSKLEQTANTSKTETSAKNKTDSYEMTPDRSSFISYDMSEIVSDDDDETPTTQKPIPSWAVGLRLRNSLLHQYYHPVDTDELFGNVWEAPDLEQMFDIKKKTYTKRTSSAIWQSPQTF